MMNVSTVVMAWTVISALSVLFSGAMMSTRIRSLRLIQRYPGNGDRPFRIFLAQQDIRRSTLRFLASVNGLGIGVALWGAAEGWFSYDALLVKNWPWGMVLLALLILLNEAWDRWALARLRWLYDRSTRHKEYGL